jgi:hypothetical protein
MAGDRRSAERPDRDGVNTIMGKAAGDHRWVKCRGRDDEELSSIRWWMWMIIDGRGGAEVWYLESHEDHCLGREVCAGASGKRILYPCGSVRD